MYKNGVDVSHWEPRVIWQEVKDAGYEFAFMKACQGIVTDEKFRDYWRDCKGILPRGAYCFYDPRYASISPARSAAYFWDLIKDDPGELPPVLDIERYTSGPYHGARYWYDWIANFHLLSGRYPLIYTAYYYWTDNVVINPVLDVRWFAEKCDLWVANYETTVPMIPYPWTDWLYWQHSETGTVPGVYNQFGQLTECDLNYYKGTIDPAPPPMEENVNYVGVVKPEVTLGLNVRTAPVTGQVIGKVYAGQVIEADELDDGWLHLTSPMVGWSSAQYIDYEEVPGPVEPPPSGEYILHVKDGVTRKFIPE